MTSRRFRVTYWLGDILVIFNVTATSSEDAQQSVPPTAEDLKVREIES